MLCMRPLGAMNIIMFFSFVFTLFRKYVSAPNYLKNLNLGNSPHLIGASSSSLEQRGLIERLAYYHQTAKFVSYSRDIQVSGRGRPDRITSTPNYERCYSLAVMLWRNAECRIGLLHDRPIRLRPRKVKARSTRLDMVDVKVKGATLALTLSTD